MSTEKEIKEETAKMGQGETPVPSFAKKATETLVSETAVVEPPAKISPEEQKPMIPTSPSEVDSTQAKSNQAVEAPKVDLRAAIEKQQEEKLNAKKVNTNRQILIKPVSIGSEIGDLLPGARKTYSPYKSASGRWVTGLTDDELQKFETIEVWDPVLKRPNDAFWSNYSLQLTSAKKVLYIDENERHLIDYKFALSIPEIANTYNERNDDTPFYIVDDEREAEIDNMEFDELTEAYTILKSMTLAQRRGFAVLLGIPVRYSSDSVVLKALREEADNDPKNFIAEWKDAGRDTKTLLHELVEYGIIQKRVDSYYFNDALLGIDELSSVQWLSSPENSDVKLKLKQQLEALKLSLR